MNSDERLKERWAEKGNDIVTENSNFYSVCYSHNQEIRTHIVKLHNDSIKEKKPDPIIGVCERCGEECPASRIGIYHECHDHRCGKIIKKEKDNA